MVVEKNPDLARVLPGLVVFIAAGLVLGVVWMGGFGALFVASVDAVAGRPVSMGRAWATVFRPKVLGTSLLMFLASTAGMFMCCIPGVLVGLLFAVTLPVMVEEGVYGPAALGRSAELMRHNPGGDLGRHPMLKAFLIFFVTLLLSYAVGLLIQLPFMVAQQVIMVRTAGEGARPDPAALVGRLVWLQVPGQVAGMLVNVLVYLYTFMALSLLFFDLRRRREATDIESALVGIEGGTAAPSAGP